MPQDPHAAFDSTVLDKIELSPIGAVPYTPAYQDALKRLYASHQVYPNADHKDGHVTARSLNGRPVFHAENLARFAAGEIDDKALESNASIFARYLDSLDPAARVAAEAHRETVPGKRIQHRKHSGGPDAATIHDPVHSLFLVPGAGTHPGLPGNYLYGYLLETMDGTAATAWALHLHDSLDGAERYDCATLAEAFAKLEELLGSAPFSLSELTEFGFHLV